MFESLKRGNAWAPSDGTYSLGEGTRISPDLQAKGYPLSRCISCGACLEVCPQVNEKNNFIGEAIISQVSLLNLHRSGAMHGREGVEAVRGRGGGGGWGKARKWVKVCSKERVVIRCIG